MAIQNFETASVFINRSILDVFRYALQVKHMESWVPWCTEVRNIKEVGGIARSYEAVFDLQIKEQIIQVQVVDVVPGKSFAIKSSFPRAVSIFEFKTISGNTLITVETMNLRWGFFESFSPLLDIYYSNWLNNALKSFRELVEGSAATSLRPIFLSYHRQDHKDATDGERHLSGRFRDSLAGEFGTSGVFLDTDSIGGGEVWESRLEAAVKNCSVVTALVDEDWSNQIMDKESKGETSWVRRELELAKKHNKTIIPVVVGSKSNLVGNIPEGLDWIVDRNWQMLRPSSDYYSDIDRIIQSVWDAITVDINFWKDTDMDVIKE